MEMLQGMQAEMKELKQDMHQRFDGLEKEIKELQIEVNEFKQVSMEEYNRVVENVDTITQKTAKHAGYINYLVRSRQAQHDIKCNRQAVKTRHSKECFFLLIERRNLTMVDMNDNEAKKAFMDMLLEAWTT